MGFIAFAVFVLVIVIVVLSIAFQLIYSCLSVLTRILLLLVDKRIVGK